MALGYHRLDLLNRKTDRITHIPEEAENGQDSLLATTSGTAVSKDLWMGTYYNFGLFYYNRATNRLTQYIRRFIGQKIGCDRNYLSEPHRIKSILKGNSAISYCDFLEEE